MKYILLTGWLTGQAALSALAQTPAVPQSVTTTPKATTVAARTTAPATRTLTAAEQRQKERIEREIQEQRQLKAEFARRQQEYLAKQAEKERQKQARQAEKERQQRERDAGKSGNASPVTTPAPTPAVVSAPQPAPAAPQPTPAEPTKADRREQRRREKEARQAAAAFPPPPAAARPDPPAPKPTESAHPEQVAEGANEPAAKPADAPTPNVVSAPVAAAPAPKAARPKRARTPTPAPSADQPPTATAAAGQPLTAAEPTMSRPRREFLPSGHLFDPILLDPLEAQAYGSVYPAYWTDGQKYRGSIVPFAFGFAKPFYRRTTAPDRASEFVLDVASFTQFEVYFDEVKRSQRRQIVNTDYKISLIYNLRRGDHTWRFRLYHLSSHLGDDYLFRNQINVPTPNSVNYELVDATHSRMVRNWRVYGNLGIGLRKPQERKRLSAQLGAFYKKPSTHFARLVGGVDVKLWQQTDFRPGIHAGIGTEIGRTQHNLTFLFEGYSGFRPYSQYENQQVQWLGVGMYLNPF